MPTTRFAPSPTGFLHLGHAFSAVYAHRAADGGLFVLRIEDIDRTRCRREFSEAIFEDLSWLGLEWETPVRVQSEHFDDYRAALSKLEGMGLLYPCFCTRAEIQAAMSAPHGPDGPVYPGTCRLLSPSEREERTGDGVPYALRLDTTLAYKMAGTVRWLDERVGERTAQPELFGDIVLARKETPASYHLCVTVDDALQGIDLVTRGEDLLRSTDVHCLLQRLLGYPTPRYRHHRLLLDDAGKKFSKRDTSVTLRELRERGETVASILERLEPFAD